MIKWNNIDNDRIMEQEIIMQLISFNRRILINKCNLKINKIKIMWHHNILLKDQAIHQFHNMGETNIAKHYNFLQ